MNYEYIQNNTDTELSEWKESAKFIPSKVNPNFGTAIVNGIRRFVQIDEQYVNKYIPDKYRKTISRPTISAYYEPMLGTQEYDKYILQKTLNKLRKHI